MERGEREFCAVTATCTLRLRYARERRIIGTFYRIDIALDEHKMANPISTFTLLICNTKEEESKCNVSRNLIKTIACIETRMH